MRATRAHLGAAVLLVSFSLLMLWPLPRLIRHAAADRERTLVNAWLYDWSWYAAVHRGASLFRADVPEATEPQLGVALFAFPLLAAGLPPLTVHNVLLLLGFAFTGYGAFVLVRVVTGSWWAGLAAGIVLAFVPWRFAHLGETQLAWAGWLPLMLAALIAFGRDPTWSRGLLFAATVFMNGLTSMHWLAFGTAAIVFAILILLIRRPRALGMAMVMLLLALVLLTPLALPYLGAVAMAPGGERPAFPGLAATVLALVGLIGPLGRDATPRRLVLFVAVLWVLIGAAGSLGAFPFVPLAPATWAMIGYTGLALLAGIGAMKVERQRHLLGAAVAALLLFELRPEPRQWQLVDAAEPPVYRWLARSPHRMIVELPAGDRHEYLFRSTIHHRKVLAGEEIVRAFAERPVDLAVIDRLKARGVTALVVHGDGLRDETAAAIRYFLLRGYDAGRLKLAGRFDRGPEGDYVFTFERGDLKPYFGPQPASRPIGWLDEPLPGADVRGPVRVKGWALAPAGIRRVRVYVNNRALAYDAQLFARPDVGALYPWHDASRAGFTIDIHREREGPTDVEVEITDSRGRAVLLPQRWFVWSP